MSTWRQLSATALWPVLASLWLAGGGPVLAADVARSVEDIDDLAHFGYAALLGTGWYQLDDRSAFVFRLPFDHVLRETTDQRPGLRLLMPVTVGLLDFDFDDILETEKDDLGTVTFLPGIEAEYRLRDNWNLRPAAHLGLGRDWTNNDWSLLYGATLKTLYSLDTGWPQIDLGGEALFGGHKPEGEAGNFLTRLAAGIDTTWATDWQIANRNVVFTAHAIAYFYTNELQFERVGQDPIEISDEYEFGIGIGGRPIVSILGFEFNRLGIAWRFSDAGDAILLITEFPF